MTHLEVLVVLANQMGRIAKVRNKTKTYRRLRMLWEGTIRTGYYRPRFGTYGQEYSVRKNCWQRDLIKTGGRRMKAGQQTC